MIKVKVSYSTQAELQQVLRLLRERIKFIRYSTEGKYKRAYIELKEE